MERKKFSALKAVPLMALAVCSSAEASERANMCVDDDQGAIEYIAHEGPMCESFEDAEEGVIWITRSALRAKTEVGLKSPTPKSSKTVAKTVTSPKSVPTPTTESAQAETPKRSKTPELAQKTEPKPVEASIKPEANKWTQKMINAIRSNTRNYDDISNSPRFWFYNAYQIDGAQKEAMEANGEISIDAVNDEITRLTNIYVATNNSSIDNKIDKLKVLQSRALIYGFSFSEITVSKKITEQVINKVNSNKANSPESPKHWIRGIGEHFGKHNLLSRSRTAVGEKITQLAIDYINHMLTVNPIDIDIWIKEIEALNHDANKKGLILDMPTITAAMFKNNNTSPKESEGETNIELN